MENIYSDTNVILATKFKAKKTITFDKKAGKYELFELI